MCNTNIIVDRKYNIRNDKITLFITDSIHDENSLSDGNR